MKVIFIKLWTSIQSLDSKSNNVKFYICFDSKTEQTENSKYGVNQVSFIFFLFNTTIKSLKFENEINIIWNICV